MNTIVSTTTTTSLSQSQLANPNPNPTVTPLTHRRSYNLTQLPNVTWQYQPNTNPVRTRSQCPSIAGGRGGGCSSNQLNQTSIGQPQPNTNPISNPICGNVFGNTEYFKMHNEDLYLLANLNPYTGDMFYFAILHPFTKRSLDKCVMPTVYNKTRSLLVHPCSMFVPAVNRRGTCGSSAGPTLSFVSPGTCSKTTTMCSGAASSRGPDTTGYFLHTKWWWYLMQPLE